MCMNKKNLGGGGGVELGKSIKINIHLAFFLKLMCYISLEKKICNAGIIHTLKKHQLKVNISMFKYAPVFQKDIFWGFFYCLLL